MSQTYDYSHRKASANICFTDVNNAPLKNIDITVRQTNNEFLFGCGAFDFQLFANLDKFINTEPKIPGFNPEAVKDRISKWLNLFNYGTLPFYWGGYEPVEGQRHNDSMHKTAEYLKSQNVQIKGHPLCWHTACANWLMNYDNDTIFQKQLERITTEVSEYAGVIDRWDVINEVVIMPIFDRYDNAITRICKDKGRVGLIKSVFQTAHEANPNAELLINDFNTSTAYEILIDGALNAGAPISTIGIQSHQHQGFWGKEKLETVLARYEHFGLPIHFTENTLVSGPLIPPEIEDLNDYKYEDGCSTPELEIRQADEYEEMYRILFAHPLVKAATCWDFTDGAWLNAPSGVLRKDNSIKPVYERLYKLIKEEWSTNCTIHTDENGYASLEGFKGTYEMSVNDSKASFVLSDLTGNGAINNITLQK